MKKFQKRPSLVNKTTNYDVKGQLRGKIGLLMGLTVLALGGLAYRVYGVQKSNAEVARTFTRSKELRQPEVIPYRRGEIMDRNGTYLTATEKRYQLIVSPKSLLKEDSRDLYYDCTVHALADFLGMDENELRKQIEENSTSQNLKVGEPLTAPDKLRFLDFQEHVNNPDRYEAKKRAEDKTYEGFSQEQRERYRGRLGAVNLQEYYQREYPYGELACNVLGFYRSYDDQRVGTTGIEQSYNEVLSGTDGQRYSYMDADREAQDVTREPQDGNSVVSTIDVKVQQSVERHIKDFMNTTGAENIGVIVMDPNSGEILAMATNHSFDLNDPGNLQKYYSANELKQMTSEEATQKLWNNFCVSTVYEPGSTAKVFTIAGALENGKITGQEEYTCTGEVDVQGTLIHCVKRTGHGRLNVTGALEQSCNVALVRIAQALGREEFEKTQNLYGFGVSSGIDLPGEPDTSTQVHILNPPDDAANRRLGPVELATDSFGQGFGCNMVQLAAAFSSVINGGSYYRPHVVKQILNPQGTVIRDYSGEIVRETCSQETALFLRKALRGVVTEGTGAAAEVPGYEIAGKTGTSEKLPRNKKNYLLSFCGYAPANNPQVLCYVVVDQPHVKDQAHSTFASVLFQNIMADILPSLNVVPGDAPGTTATPLLEGINAGIASGREEGGESANAAESTATAESAGASESTAASDSAAAADSTAASDSAAAAASTAAAGSPAAQETETAAESRTAAQKSSTAAAKSGASSKRGKTSKSTKSGSSSKSSKTSKSTKSGNSAKNATKSGKSSKSGSSSKKK